MLGKIKNEQVRIRNIDTYERTRNDAKDLCTLITFARPRYKTRIRERLKPLPSPTTKFEKEKSQMWCRDLKAIPGKRKGFLDDNSKGSPEWNSSTMDQCNRY